MPYTARHTLCVKHYALNRCRRCYAKYLLVSSLLQRLLKFRFPELSGKQREMNRARVRHVVEKIEQVIAAVMGDSRRLDQQI